MMSSASRSRFSGLDNVSLQTISPVTPDDSILENDLDPSKGTAKIRAHLQSFVFTSKQLEAEDLATPSFRPISEVTMPVVSKRNTRAASKAVPSNTLVQTSLIYKRAADDGEDDVTSTKPAKKKRSTKQQRSATDPHNPVNNLVDSLRPGLILVFIGLNPGLRTAETGHAYAHPTNLFWRLLYQSGVTSRRHDPSETRDLMDLYSIGNTNICSRPTRTGDGLSKEELVEGAAILEAKIAKFRPQAVCIVGKGIWEAIYKAKTGKALKSKEFEYGWQDSSLWLGRTRSKAEAKAWQGARTFVATTTSGLAAGMKPDEKLEIWKPLGQWFSQQRKEPTSEVKQEEVIKVEVEEEDVKSESEDRKINQFATDEE